MSALSFASIVIWNCGIDGSRVRAIDLKATPVFPACSQSLYAPKPVSDDWAAKDISGRQGLLELELLERISEGRIGLVFSVSVLSATNGDGRDVSASLPSQICLKFAKKQYCRSLAREAWFYEKMADCQGFSIPQCFGFYTSSFRSISGSLDTIIPWTNVKYPYEPVSNSRLLHLSVDWLADDDPEATEFSDTRGFKRDSPWNLWNPSQEDPTIAVLLLEKLGETMDNHWKSFQEPEPELLIDIKYLVEDLCEHGIVHTNLTVFNLLKFPGPENSVSRCPRHNITHRWRVIDFDRSLIFDMQHGRESTKRALKGMNMNAVGRLAVFWGDIEE